MNDINTKEHGDNVAAMLQADIDEMIRRMEKEIGHRVADITPEIYDKAYLLRSVAQSYAASACKNQTARAEMQQLGRQLVRKVLFLAFLLEWDYEEVGEHKTPTESLLKTMERFLMEDRLKDIRSDNSPYYSHRARAYEGD